MTTFLKRLLFDDDRLRERTLTELVHAFETGRMVAFVGSMATEAFGYGRWDELVERYVGDARTIAGFEGGGRPVQRGRQQAVDALASLADHHQSGKIVEKRVALSVAREALDQLDSVDPFRPWRRREAGEGVLAGSVFRAGSRLAAAAPALKDAGVGRVELLDRATADAFLRRGNGAEDDTPSVIRGLFRDLRVHRFVTLNYDLEIEAELMVEAGDEGKGLGAVERLRQLIGDGKIQRDREVKTRLSRFLADGSVVESDVRDRERPDRLIEFAVGSAVVGRRIMHLHGRATDPETMIVGLRDYDRLYRKNDPARVAFEHGQRVLFAGNPVLFVGTGMSEPEITWTLQDFVSNNPYRRFAPTFLLWQTGALSSDDTERTQEKWLKRIDFFRRFGVLTLFDEDLEPAKSAPYRASWDRLEADLKQARKTPDDPPRPLMLGLLSASIPLLGEACRAHHAAMRDWGKEWRSLQERLEGKAQRSRFAPDERGLIALWSTPRIRSDVPANLKELFGKPEAQSLPIRAVVARSGAGKGMLAWKVAREDPLDEFGADEDRRLIVNAGYALDSDFLLLAISRFLLKLKGEEDWEKGEARSREKQFEAPGAFKLHGRRALIIINGIERFFTVEGAPLSAELDHLLRCAARDTEGDVRWLILGNPRITRYFQTICAPAVVRFGDVCPEAELAHSGHRGALKDPPAIRLEAEEASEDETGVEADAAGTIPVRSVYFNYLVSRMEAFARGKGRSEIANPGDLVVLEAHKRAQPRAISRVVVDTFVRIDTLERAGIADAALAMEALRALAFIGNPVEAAVLLHVPRIRERLKEDGEPGWEELDRVLGELIQMGIVLEMEGFRTYPDEKLWRRYGLHTAVSSELRRRVGVPLTESKLSTSFNMSLFVAQPVDSYVPDAAIHDELGTLIDHLVGAYKDGDWGKPEDPPVRANEEKRRSGAHATAALRAALAVIRSYYSTTSLLSLEGDDRPLREDRDGVLLEHAERLETLLGAFRKMRRARDAVAKEERGGPEPFYAEDLVWVLNELGVVYLAQGDLYGARRSFDEAMSVNRKWVEFQCHSHNWRRIAMNQVLVDIERADLSGADEKLREIETSIDARGSDGRHDGCSRFDAIQREFGIRGHPERACFDPKVMHEEILMTGMVLGHRGFVHHLRGHLSTAAPLYEEAIALFRRLQEHRAYAMFQRLYAQLLNITDSPKSHLAVRLAVTASESVRQMDMAYHARTVEAHESWQAKPADAKARRQAVYELTHTLSYASTMDLYRLRVEAGLYLARLKLDSGDYDSALEHATDALSVAARNGLTLRKISLRIEIGHILVRRGDVKSGGALISGAAETAERFGYQRAVEVAHRIRVEQGLSD